MGDLKRGTLEVMNPQDPNTFITLDISNAKTKTSISYDGENITLYKDIKVKCLIGESQSRLIVDEKLLNLLELEEEAVLDISNAKTKTSISYDGENITLYKDIKVKCLIGESQSRLIVDEKLLNLLELEEEAVIKQYLELFFESFKESDIDIVNVGNLFYRKYPDEVLEKDPISITNLKINVDVEIDGTTITGNTL
ncbi:Ger(x)C family spore germination C-terminal domain-containing protein [Clostridium perfringens]